MYLQPSCSSFNYKF